LTLRGVKTEKPTMVFVLSALTSLITATCHCHCRFEFLCHMFLYLWKCDGKVLSPVSCFTERGCNTNTECDLSVMPHVVHYIFSCHSHYYLPLLSLQKIQSGVCD
jgi:hypothetical protein